jgi:hypothetical protein
MQKIKSLCSLLPIVLRLKQQLVQHILMKRENKHNRKRINPLLKIRKIKASKTLHQEMF